MRLTNEHYMLQAIRLAHRSLGQTAPNPAVGCVIVRDKVIVGRGWTQAGGRPHAEPQALAQAGRKARGATAYVTLEPCAHQGETPPCTSALIGAGIKRVVYAMADPAPHNRGLGASVLRQAGVSVTAGVCGPAAQKLHRGFVLRVRAARPFITLKLATYANGDSVARQGRWITQVRARARGHLLRAEHDAILVGRATVAKDKPQLDCRLPGLEHASPRPVILDSQLRLPTQLGIFARRPIVFCASSVDAARLARWRKRLPSVYPVEQDTHGLHMPAVMQKLAQLGITRVLIEGGAKTIRAALASGMVDALAWFRPHNQDTSKTKPIGVRACFPPPKGHGWQLVNQEFWGPDVAEFYALQARASAKQVC